MKLNTFLYQHPVFTWQEFLTDIKTQGQTHLPSQKALLAYHKKANHLIGIRQGLYASIPPGCDPTSIIVDPYLIAGKSSPDSVLSYHTALSLHGIAYSIFHRFFFTTQAQIKPFVYQSQEFISIKVPTKLLKAKQILFGVEITERQGLEIKVTNLARTLVDVLDRPELGGGLEEMWRSLEMLAVVDIEQVIEYALLLKNSTLIAKVGFFLEQHQSQLIVTNSQLEKLEKHKPRNKHYFDNTRRQSGIYLKRWNLVVPKELLNKNWEEQNVLI